MLAKKKIVIAIDGHSSCGKSTLAKLIAKKLGYAYVDSGAMYRSATLYAINQNLLKKDTIDKQALINHLENIHINFEYSAKNQRNETYLNGENVEDEIRTHKVSELVSEVSTIKEVRRHMVALQQEMGENKGLVMDGRDIATVVFPDAELKIFLTASAEVRAQRRFDELRDKGESTSLEDVLNNVKKRDHMDQTRIESPLRKAYDAIILDNSSISLKEEWDWVKQLLKERDVI